MTGAKPPFPTIAPLGDQALTVTFGDRIDPEAAAQVDGLRRRLEVRGTPGVVELVPGYVALTIHYRATEIDFGSIKKLIQEALVAPFQAAETAAGRLIEIPVDYDGPDLVEVAGTTGLSPDDVVARHSNRDYRVALLGFVPGFGYLTELDPLLVLPRRPAPRPRVPAGSVAIAGAQTGVYPAATPGGWHLIGRTTVSMFDPTRPEPSLLRVGDRVRFVALR